MASESNNTVLIIEDNFFMAQLLLEKLSHQGLSAVHAQDGKTGLSLIEKGKPALVLVDIPLAGELNGFETLEAIKKHDDLKDVIVLVLFNTSVKKDIEKLSTIGYTEYLIKADNNADGIVAKARELVFGVTAKPTDTGEHNDAAPSSVGGSAIMSTPGIKNTGGIDFAARALALKDDVEKMLKLPETEISIIKLVDDMMAYGYSARASDVHLEPFEDHVMARMRIDGILNDVFSFQKNLHSGIITRIKVLGGMRTDEHQAAQDGRFRMAIADLDRHFDVRVSIVPTYYGENAVLRLLAEQTSINSLDDLALTDFDRKKIRKAVQTPYGMILATGPTGSGKTTTLYTILRELNTREVSVITIEDPIEYSLEGVDQIQVNARTGLTFANGLRSVLRQDPNIIMVGEIRDQETASIAVNAALTGHKLLSTIHTNDAATTLPRLLDMGIEPFLVASTVNVAIGQRLVRMICSDCKAPRIITDGEFNALKENIPASILDDHRNFSQGKGCAVCNHTGIP
jgi:type II secretory ATPase GspE/PulE/Tfp pilus assembly ATPase PilB-like protein/ActR/RegA family two-component response regulator